MSSPWLYGDGLFSSVCWLSVARDSVSAFGPTTQWTKNEARTSHRINETRAVTFVGGVRSTFLLKENVPSDCDLAGWRLFTLVDTSMSAIPSRCFLGVLRHSTSCELVRVCLGLVPLTLSQSDR